MTTRLTFPTDFVWGTATAAYQIEGAAFEDDRSPSIWDTFCRMPGKVTNSDNGDVACDHYHRLESDLDLMASLGLPSYRFSVSWPRVIPDAGEKVNQVGLDFYQRVVDGLLERGITPLLTLYHWDLPQALEEAGGWVNRDTVDRFVDFAEVVGRALGDRVPTLTTLNEPFCSAFLGYASGVHAPGVRDNGSALAAAHHLNLAHGRAVSALRAVLPAQSRVSVTLNIHQLEPASDSDADQAACQHVDAIANRVFLDPILRGRYPEQLPAVTRHLSDWGFVKDGDLGEISAPIDVLGINYYSPAWIAAPTADTQDRLWPGTDLAASVLPPGPYTEMGWPIEAEALTRLLSRVHSDYPEMPLVVTENGCAYDDAVTTDGRVHDIERVAYLTSHLVAVRAAIDAGVDVRGYYVWSLMDNFEWAWGYSQRFGIVHVDYETLQRTPKDSALWFRNVIARNGLDIAD